MAEPQKPEQQPDKSSAQHPSAASTSGEPDNSSTSAQHLSANLDTVQHPDGGGGNTTDEEGNSASRKASVSSTSSTKTPIRSLAETFSAASPEGSDVVYQYPIRSAIHIDPNKSADPMWTPAVRSDRSDGYFPPLRGENRRMSVSTPGNSKSRQSSADMASTASDDDVRSPGASSAGKMGFSRSNAPRLPPQVFNDIVAHRSDFGHAEVPSSPRDFHSSSAGVSRGDASARSMNSVDDLGGLVTTRFKHVVVDGGHHIITGRDGKLERCEDEPIQCPGAVQGYGLLLALKEEEEGRYTVRIASENSYRLIGYTPKQLFALDNFCDILADEQADNLMDHIDFVRDEDADLEANGPEVFTMTIKSTGRRSKKLWCALHVSEELNPGLIICEFELEDDPLCPLVPPNNHTPELPEDTLGSDPTEEEYAESTQNLSRPLRVLRSARKRKGETAAMEVFNIMSQVQEQLAIAPNLDVFLKVLVGIVKELTGFHRVMMYQFDKLFNGRVVTELVDPRATKDLYKGLNFPASDIPAQARQLYKVNKVRLLYDRDQETARLVCRSAEDLERPLDLTHSHLRAMSPIHIKYLTNMAVRSSMSISINAFGELWGLIACHTYGPLGMRVSFPIRKMCRLVGDAASRNIERLSYASRLQARKLISTQPTQANPSGYIVASSEDLLKLFDADSGLLSIREETKILGDIDHSQEALALLEYLRMRKFSSVLTSHDIKQDFPDLSYQPGFTSIAGMLVVPLSSAGQDFIVFFRKGQLREVKWAGNPYEKFIRQGTEAFLEPRKSFRSWSEMVVGRCREWTEEEIETAAVLCLVYGKFIEVWRQKEAALQNSQLTRLLLANSAHEVRTPLNAIINYLEIALEGSLDQETRDNLAKSHSASKSLIYVINDLLDLTNTEEGVDLVTGDVFDIRATLTEATDLFVGDAQRKNITYEVIESPEVPHKVLGDQRRVRQAISNITANAIQNTNTGGVRVEMYVASWEVNRCSIEIAVSDTGVGMSAKKLDALFRELEQVQTEPTSIIERTLTQDAQQAAQAESEAAKKTLGLGLAVVARTVRNMQGQLRLKSEEGQGSRFVIQLPFDLPETEAKDKLLEETPGGSLTPTMDASEKTLVYAMASPSRRPSHEMERKKSTESAQSIKSIGSFRSGNSATSGRSAMSDVDRLIEDMQKPTVLESPRSANELHMARPSYSKRHPSYAGVSSPKKARSKSLEGIARPPTAHSRVSTPGQATVAYSGYPIKSIKMPDEPTSPPPEDLSPKSGILGEVYSEEQRKRLEGMPLDTLSMRILVAEDDPINSKIIKKRLEKLGHEVKLTVNGEECASVYADGYKPDCILMDIQMPIVDGMASTRRIRAHETSHPQHELSPRAQLNGRVPIIAVSASLVEKERQTYIDTGFDGWILKPVSFQRLNDLMKGIVDRKTREEALYQPGKWERGGWFMMAKQLESKSTATSADEVLPRAESTLAPPPTKEYVSEDSDNVTPTGASIERSDFAADSQIDEQQPQTTESVKPTDDVNRRETSSAPAKLNRTSSDGSEQVFSTPMSTPPSQTLEQESVGQGDMDSSQNPPMK